MARRTIWVAELRISERTAAKISAKHGISQHDVRDAVVCVSGLRAEGDTHPDRGFRWLIDAEIDGRDFRIVLYPSPVEPDVHALGSDYRRN